MSQCTKKEENDAIKCVDHLIVSMLVLVLLLLLLHSYWCLFAASNTRTMYFIDFNHYLTVWHHTFTLINRLNGDQNIIIIGLAADGLYVIDLIYRLRIANHHGTVSYTYKVHTLNHADTRSPLLNSMKEI